MVGPEFVWLSLQIGAPSPQSHPPARPRALIHAQFGGTILKLGTKRHHDLLLKGITSLSDVGCFALTELGFGASCGVRCINVVWWMECGVDLQPAF